MQVTPPPAAHVRPSSITSFTPSIEPSEAPQSLAPDKQRRRTRAYLTSATTRGTGFAIGAGLAAGLTVPFVAKVAADVHVFPAACLLEAGATSLQWTAGWFIPQSGAPLFPLTVKHAALLAAAATVGSIAAPSTLVLGLQHTSAASVALSANLEPFLAAAGSWALLDDRPSKYMFAAALAAVGSGVLCTLGQLQQAPASGPGLGIAAASAASWAAFDVAMYALHDLRAQYVVGVSTAMGALVCAALAGATGQSFPSGTHAAKMFGLGVAAFGTVDTLLSLSMRSIGAGRAALLFGAVTLCSGVGLSCALDQGRFTPLIGASLGVALLGTLILASEQFAKSVGTPVVATPPAAADAMEMV